MKVSFSTFLTINILTILMVDMAPLTLEGNITLTNKAERKKEEMDFEKLFENLQPAKMENVIEDIQEVIQFDIDLLLGGSAELLLQNGASSTAEKNTKDNKKADAKKTENDNNNNNDASSTAKKTTTSEKGASSKSAKLKSRVKRSSQRMDTMGRARSNPHNSYYAQIRRNKESICKRRCYWRRMFYLSKYGRRMTQPCNC